MKTIKLTLVLLLLGVAGVGNVWADRGYGHGHFGVMIGPVWGWPWHYPPPGYYYPPPYYPPLVVERAAPQVYVEQPQVVVAPPAPAAAAVAPPANYWYYCAAAKGYYPYVRECPSGWQRVLPQPPGQP